MVTEDQGTSSEIRHDEGLLLSMSAMKVLKFLVRVQELSFGALRKPYPSNNEKENACFIMNAMIGNRGEREKVVEMRQDSSGNATHVLARASQRQNGT